MHYHSFLPHPALQAYIENYWELYTLTEEDATKESCVIPDGNSSLMFIDQAVKRRTRQPGNADCYSGQSLIVGQKSRPVFYTFPTGPFSRNFGVRFRPLGLARFLPLPMTELTDAVVPAETLFGKSIHSLHQQVHTAADWPGRKLILDRFFLRQLQPLHESFQLAEHLTEKILQGRGQMKIGSLVQDTGISARQTDRLFQRFFGLPPKFFARIVRFNHCVFLQRQHNFAKLTDLAYANGYFDQMHFIKEIKDFTQQTPGRYFGKSDPMEKALDQVLEDRFSAKASV
jgi:AraC-like DNA-binding protein